MHLHALLTLLACAARPAATPAAPAAAIPPTAPPAVAAVDQPPQGLNDAFLAEDLDAQQWTQRFERPEREVYAYREQVVAALGLPPGAAVADVGAGTGAYVGPLAEAVGPQGTVYAVELSPGFVQHLAERAAAAGLTQVQVIQSTDAATNLPPESVDVAILVDVYHHLEQDEPFLADLARALRPDGRMVLVEFERIPGVSSDWILEHVALSQEEVQARLLGFGWRDPVELTPPGMTENYVLSVQRP